MAHLDRLFFHSWGVILFILACLLTYEHDLNNKIQEMNKLQTKHAELLQKKAILSTKKESLQKQINSQSDPRWVELVLMKSLGVVPEGQVKVVFINKE